MQSFGALPEDLSHQYRQDRRQRVVDEFRESARRAWTTVRKRSRYYIPILAWLPKYRWRHTLGADTAAGLTTALLLIPQSLSYSISLCRLPPIMGLYSSLFPLLIYGVLGSSRQLGIGPEALISLLIGNAVMANVDVSPPPAPVPLPPPVPPIDGGGGDPALSMLLFNDAGGLADVTAQKMAIATTLSLLVGLFTMFLGLARLGFMDSVIVSRPLLRGFVTAVACVIFIEQLEDLLGIPMPVQHGTESPFAKLLSILRHLGKTNWVTLLISIACISFLFGVSWLKTRITEHGWWREVLAESEPVRVVDEEESASLLNAPPNDEPSPIVQPHRPITRRRIQGLLLRLFLVTPEILLVVATMILVSSGLQLNERFDVAILGTKTTTADDPNPLRPGFRHIVLPHLTAARVRELIMPALLISVLGFVESTVAAKQYAQRYHYSVSPNRELVAFGAINIIGSVLNTFPVFASLPRSQLNDQAGAKTQLSGVITAFIVLMTVWLLVGVFWWAPMCALASVVCVAAYGLLEFEDVHFMVRIRAWSDLALMALMFCVTIFWSVEAGVLMSIGISLVLVVKQTTKVKMSVLIKVPESLLSAGQVNEDNGDGNGNGKDHSDATSPTNNAAPSSPPGATTAAADHLPLQQLLKPNNQRHPEQRVKYKYRPLEEIYQYHVQSFGTDARFRLPLQDILVVKIEEALFFGNSGQLMDRLRRAEAYNGFLHTHPSEEATRAIKPSAGEGGGGEGGSAEEVPTGASPFIHVSGGVGTSTTTSQHRPIINSMHSSTSKTSDEMLVGGVDEVDEPVINKPPSPQLMSASAPPVSALSARNPLERLRRKLAPFGLSKSPSRGRVIKVNLDSNGRDDDSLSTTDDDDDDDDEYDDDGRSGLVIKRFDDREMTMDAAQPSNPTITTTKVLSSAGSSSTAAVSSSAGTGVADSYLRAVIFDIENMPSIDASALHSLQHIVSSYLSRGIYVCFVKMRENVKRAFLRSGLLGDALGSEWFFRKIGDAEVCLRRRMVGEGGGDGGLRSPPPPPRHRPYVNPQAPLPVMPVEEGYSTYSIL